MTLQKFLTLFIFYTFAFKKEVYEVPAYLDTCKELIHFRALMPECSRRAFCMCMHQYGLLKCHFKKPATETFSVNCLRSLPAFAGCFLELNDLYWVLRSTNVFFKVSRHFYDESEFIVASLSPVRGQSFLS